MNKITEIIPDDIPKWMADAINNGQLAAETLKRIKDLSDARREAESLALSLYKQHYKTSSSEFELCDSVAGVITQIDNMVSGLSFKRK